MSKVLKGLVPGWVTSWEAPSSQPQIAHKRPFLCPLDDCHASYKRKDHLTRHLLRHQGKLFTCPVGNCDHKFAFKFNVSRHVRKLHNDDRSRVKRGPYTCQENGCGKTFKFLSKLKKHGVSHIKLDFTEVICAECMEYFSAVKYLKAHLRSSHKHITCDLCGTRLLRVNFKSHQKIHGRQLGDERVMCSFGGCSCSFSKVSNLRKHVKAAHFKLQPFTCRVPGCGRTFAYKHVRDNHEKSGVHVIVSGDFVDTDEQFRSRPRGGRKRKNISVESLFRKRVLPIPHNSVLDDGNEYANWLLSM